MKILAGYDNRGIVYDSGDAIIRKISAGYFKEIEDVYSIYENTDLNQRGIVETEIDRANHSLKHRKHIISYPYEWTASMFKVAVLFHLNLFSSLDKSGLTLKDALPGNVIFDFYKPIFVDFMSIVHKDKLHNESWLIKDTNCADLRFAVFNRMFIPYILVPFLAMGKKDYTLSRKLLSKNACNCGERGPRWDDLKNSNPLRFKFFVKTWLKCLLFKNNFAHIKQAKNLMKLKDRLGFLDFNKRVLEFVEGVDVTPPRSGYTTYYRDKNEDFDFNDQTRWTNKQKNIYRLINETKPKRVLDIGANTGWFSILAEKEGAEVIATDIDESSIDILYRKAKDHGLKILSILLPFNAFEKKIFGVSYKEKDYEGRDFENTPLFLPATERLKSDMVLCLGLLHHLILGMGNDIDMVFRTLSKLTEKRLILEFVRLNDNLIRGDTSFFKSINNYSEHNYNIDIVRNAGLKYFKSVQVMDSDTQTRNLLIFVKS